MHVADTLGGIQQVEQQGGGDVVGQVPHHAQAVRGRCQGAEIELKGVCHVDAQVPAVRTARAERGGQLGVDLDHLQAAQPIEQRAGDGPLTRTDLHHGLARLRGDGVHDAADDSGVVEEVLTEALAGAVVHAVPPPLMRSSASTRARLRSPSWITAG